jgi:cyanophycin synthetase
VLGTLDALRLPGGQAVDTCALLAGIATAWALDITPELIGAGIKTLNTRPDCP